jgi:hypothetical protein
MQPRKQKLVARSNDVSSHLNCERLAGLRTMLIEQKIEERQLRAAQLRQVVAALGVFNAATKQCDRFLELP